MNKKHTKNTRSLKGIRALKKSVLKYGLTFSCVNWDMGMAQQGDQFCAENESIGSAENVEI